VGVAYDATWDKGNTWGGTILDAATTWSSDIFVTGDVTIAAGGSLTIDPGVTVTFVPTDQDGDGIGDFALVRAAGDLTVNGSPVSPVTFDVLGTVPGGGGYRAVEGTDSGTTTITNATLQDGKHGIHSTAGATSLTSVTVTDTSDHAVWIAGSGSLTASALTTTGAAGTGLYLQGSGLMDVDGLAATLNSDWGVWFGSTSNAANVVTNATITDNGLGGVLSTSGKGSVTHSNVRQNRGYGFKLVGNGAGTISDNVIYYNGCRSSWFNA
jgi:hypothetical protein